MRRFQKVLFALAVVVALGASTASAQVQFFVSASGARQVRSEGITEAVGTIAFAANSTGNIMAGSVITLDYGTTVFQFGGVPSGTIGTSCVPNGGAGALVAASGNFVTITVTGVAPGAFFACTAGNSIQITGIRVNANQLGAGTSVNVAVSATVPAAFAASNPVTLISVSALTVATVQLSPSTTTTGPTAVNLVTPTAVLLCNSTNLTAINSVQFAFNVVEKFGPVFLTGGAGGDEAGLGAVPAVNPSAFRLRFGFTGIPIGVRLDSAAAGPGTTLLPVAVTITNNIPAGGITSAAGSQDFDLDVTITASNTTLVDTLVVVIGWSVPDVTKLTTVDQTGNVRVRLRGASDIFSGYPVFAAVDQFNGPAIRALACASYLLFPWVAYTGDGAVDTGLAIANTTKDPPAIGSASQTGDVTLYFWRAAGGTSPAPLKIATALQGGQTTTYVLSALGAPFSGYIIAHCTFQMGHGLAAFLSGGAFNGYIAMSLTNPRLIGTVTEISGH